MEDVVASDTVERLAAVIVSRPLVTLQGPAGAALTRCAAELAARLRPSFRDGVWWVDLTWTPGYAVAERVAVTLGAPTDPLRPAEGGLVRHLSDRSALLVLEGCDRVRVRCAGLADLLRRQCPKTRLLAIGCGPLGLLDETCLTISGTRTTDENDDRATVERRHRDLTPASRLVLAGLAAFRGGFTAHAAESVIRDELTPLVTRSAFAELLDCGLVGEDRRPGTSGQGKQRYRVPEAVRRYVGHVDVEASAAARHRHARYWASVAAAAAPGLDGRDQGRWLGRLATERDNLAAALDWLTEQGSIAEALTTAGALGRFWWLTGSFAEGRQLLRTALAAPGAGEPTPARAAALHALGLATFWHETRPVEARRSGACFAEAVRIYRSFGDSERLARALRDLGSHFNSVGDADRARDLLTESVAMARRCGKAAAAGVGLCYLGIAASYLGDRVEARARLEEALVLLTGDGGDDELIRTQFFLACLECDDGNPVAARARFQALVAGRQLIPALSYAEGFALDGLSRLAAAEERFPDALRLFGAAAAAHDRRGTSAGAAYTAYVRRGLDAARRECGEEQAAGCVDEGRRWTLAQAVERGLAAPEAPGERLRGREIEVLRLADAGLGDHEIARVLFLSPRTVGNHLTSAYRRLGVHSRTAAARLARRQGLI